METAAAMLESGEVDGVVCETPAGTYYINHNGHKNLTMSSYVLTSNLLSFPLKKNSPLRAAIDLGIVELQENEAVLNICRKYVGDDASRCNL